MIRTEIDSMPAELDESCRARSCSMEIEEAALKKEDRRAQRSERLEKLQKELAEHARKVQAK